MLATETYSFMHRQTHTPNDSIIKKAVSYKCLKLLYHTYAAAAGVYAAVTTCTFRIVRERSCCMRAAQTHLLTFATDSTHTLIHTHTDWQLWESLCRTRLN